MAAEMKSQVSALHGVAAKLQVVCGSEDTFFLRDVWDNVCLLNTVLLMCTMTASLLSLYKTIWLIIKVSQE